MEAASLPNYEHEPQKPVFEAIVEAQSEPQFARIGRGPVGKLVELSDRNQHLTVFNKKLGQHEVVYQGSALIVEALEIYKNLPSPQNQHRPMFGLLSFFDRLGNFYDFARVESVHLDGQASSINARKHVAVFTANRHETPTQFSLAIDDIYCVSLTPHPIIGDERFTDYDDN